MKKGFTLIELLAVIVILAIIAIIAMPIVLNIINDSKTSSDEQTVELYLDTIKKAITKKQLNNPNFNPDECIIKTSGKLECFKNEESLGIIVVDMKGEVPENGIIEIENNRFIYRNILFNKKIYYPFSILEDDTDNNKKISVGDKYKIKVNDTDEFYFYVLSLNSNNTVNLIMNSNICEDGTIITNENKCLYAWSSKEDYGDENFPTWGWNNKGPITAMQKLYNATKNWNKVPNMIINYDDEYNKTATDMGYTGIYTDEKTLITTIVGKPETLITTLETEENKPLKARLPETRELLMNNCSWSYYQGSYGKCPIWLVENLSYMDVTSDRGYDKYIGNKNNGLEQIYGYWSLSSGTWQGRNDYLSFHLRFTGCISSVNTNQLYGIRPVITVPINYLSIS